MFDFLGVVTNEVGGWGNIFNHEGAQKDLERKLNSVSKQTSYEEDSSTIVVINDSSSPSSNISANQGLDESTATMLAGATSIVSTGDGDNSYDILNKGA